ncbi:hypothetical protein TNCV_2782831 [Trichonephila clavipes]|nr:hypothetical protein TNCV_2782831 [Trichonephila clavipes]
MRVGSVCHRIVDANWIWHESGTAFSVQKIPGKGPISDMQYHGDCLDSEGIQRLVWPAHSPELNPIGNVGDALGGKLLVETIIRQTRTPLPCTYIGMGQQLLHHVVQSMVRRVNVASHSTVDISRTDTFI